MSRRRRLDAELVRRGLATSRTVAQTLIAEGRVTVGGAPAAKASRMVDPGDAIEVIGDGPRFVSRGGDKLDAALDRFALDVAGRRIVDAGSSTGGFTDCVLQRGAAEVVAIDVGRNQLHERLRADPRVAVHEQTNLRHVDPADLGGPGDLVVADLSFISLRLALPPALALASPGARCAVLVKPQFEVGRAGVGKGGLVPPDAAETCARALRAWLDTVPGWRSLGLVPSPIDGADGNREWLLGGAKDRADSDAAPPKGMDDHG